jgi:hypothetical protein
LQVLHRFESSGCRKAENSGVLFPKNTVSNRPISEQRTENRELDLERIASTSAESAAREASAAATAESRARGTGARRGGEGLAGGV